MILPEKGNKIIAKVFSMTALLCALSFHLINNCSHIYIHLKLLFDHLMPLDWIYGILNVINFRLILFNSNQAVYGSDEHYCILYVLLLTYFTDIPSASTNYEYPLKYSKYVDLSSYWTKKIEWCWIFGFLFCLGETYILKRSFLKCCFNPNSPLI